MSSIVLSAAVPHDARARLSRLMALRPMALRLAAMVLALAVAAPAPRAEDSAEVARLEVGEQTSGLPTPRGAHDVVRQSGPILRELKAAIAADPAAVLAFYRRELEARGWTLDKAGAVDSAAETRRGFSGAEGTAVLVLTRPADETRISLVIRASEEVVAARALEARAAERAARGEEFADPDEVGNAPLPTDLGRSSALLRPRADLALPVPVPETAEAVAHDAASGRLTFTAHASVRALESFYRGVLKAQGFVETPHEPRAGVAELEFARTGDNRSGDKKGAEKKSDEKGAEDRLILTFARAGTGVLVTATGNALKTAAQ